MANQKVFNGTAWVLKPTYAFDGAAQAFGSRQLYWDGAAWTAFVPDSVTDLAVTTNDASTVVLGWSRHAHGCKHDVHRSTTSGFTPGAGNVIASNQTGLTYTDSTPPSNTIAYYKVVSKNDAQTATSNEASADRQAPGTFTATATKQFGPQVEVTWTSATGATSYDVARSTNGGAYVDLQLGATSPYTDSTVSDGNSYTYRVTANNTFGTSTATTSSVTIDVPGAPANLSAVSVGSGDEVEVSWTAPSDTGGGVTGYRWRVDAGAWTEVSSATLLISQGPGLTLDDDRVYDVQAKSADGWSTSATDTAYTKPATPSVSVAAKAGTYDTITVTPSNASAIATTCDVLRNTVNDSGTAATIQTGVSFAAFDDTGLSSDTTYYYWVQAQNPDSGGVDSALSTVASATTNAAPTLTNVSVTIDAVKNDHNVQWDQNAAVKSVKVEYQYRDGSDVELGFVTHASSPSETDGAATVVFATVDGDASIEGYDVQYRVTPYDANALGGTAGTAVTTAWSGPF